MLTTRNNEDRLILLLLKGKGDRSEIEKILDNPGFNEDYFFDMIDRHLVEAETLEALGSFKLPDSLKERSYRRYKKSSTEAIGNNLIIRSELQKIVSLLEQSGVDSFLMKGPSLDFTGLRVCRDLDILVREEKLLESITIIERAGYRYVGNEINTILTREERKDLKLQLPWNNQYQLYSAEKNLMVEIHTNLFERDRVYHDNINLLLDGIDGIWGRKVFNEKLGVSVLSDEDILMLMCMHVAVKRTFSKNTFILRNLCDIERLIDRGVDWNRFLLNINGMKIEHYLLFSLVVAQDLLCSDVPQSVIESLTERSERIELLLSRLHFRSFKSLKYNRPIFSVLYRILSSFFFNRKGAVVKGMGVILRLFFPAPERMSKITGLNRTNPALIFGYFFNLLRMPFLVLRNLLRRY